ncbi:MAG: deoxyribose-phosphate aldolase [Oscillospiraceae bacterium]|nr:deoxyribose-phosphate aldolase [Oscillospiraceae bacterium]
MESNKLKIRQQALQLIDRIDHTNLKICATEKDIINLCNEAIKYQTASVCIAPAYVKIASEFLKSYSNISANRVRICTVIGFPNGYATTASKLFEAKNAIENGAAEIDMVINIGFLKDKKFFELEKEINLIKNACGEHILKVIIETCLLTDEEKKIMCEICLNACADYIKTSTGFSTGGATLEDIKLMKSTIGNRKLKIKAAGGVKSFEDLIEFVNAGADRIGTSRIIKLLEDEKQ